jgi:5-methylcytosine-specific restriction protein B
MAASRREVLRSATPLRRLSADDLGIGAESAIHAHSSNQPDDPPLAENDPRYKEVLSLLERYGGIIFSGPPGTSKSWYAAKIASRLVDEDKTRIRFVQFHPSYQYEDFMQGFRPNENNDGFTMTDKYFVAMCRAATLDPARPYVLVIDELSRADASRVFGEALTYVEKSKRGLYFDLASGEELTVPANIVILATMNPLDRGVDDVDAAFERRFAKIAMNPDRDVLNDRLIENGAPEYLRARVLAFFDRANGYARTNPQAAIGHTFFWDVSDEPGLRSLWDHQLCFLVEKAHRLDPETLVELERSYEQIFEPAPNRSSESGADAAIGDDEQL